MSIEILLCYGKYALAGRESKMEALTGRFSIGTKLKAFHPIHQVMEEAVIFSQKCDGYCVPYGIVVRFKDNLTQYFHKAYINLDKPERSLLRF